MVEHRQLHNRKRALKRIRENTEAPPKGSLLADPETVSKILDASGVGLFNVDLATGLSVVSPTWKTMIGLPADADIEPQKVWLERVHPEDREVFEALDRDLIAGNIPESKCVVRVRHMDGHWIWLETTANVIHRDIYGKALSLAGTHIDVTAEHATRRIASEIDERNRLMMRHATMGIAIFGTDARLQDCNQVFREMVGYTENEILGMNLMKLVWFDLDPDEVRKKQDFYAGKTESISFETVLQCKDKSRKNALVTGVRFYNREGVLRFLFQCSDITERVSAERQKDEFVSTVSHELRTPLTSIIGAIKLVSDGRLGELSPPVLQMLAMAERNCNHLLQLVNELLDFKALEAGGMKYNFENVHVGPVSEGVIDGLTGYRKKAQRLDLNVTEAGAAAVVHADPARLRQILVNLLSNALKFSPEDGVVTLNVDCADSVVRFEVVDQGGGVQEDVFDQIFQKFAQANSSDNRAIKGTGLGLAISQRMTHEMNGKIGFYNNSDRGATFWVTFPEMPD